MESYANILELNVWTSSEVTSAKQDDVTKEWTVHIKRTNADASVEDREFKVKHVVFAIGWNGGGPNIPKFPGTVCVWFLASYKQN
jgi:cation diffusion facilitator CzcD-associated flavoprotein CzcO